LSATLGNVEESLDRLPAVRLLAPGGQHGQCLPEPAVARRAHAAAEPLAPADQVHVVGDGIAEISLALAKELSIGFQSMASGKTNGLIVYNDSAWDSNIMGRRVGTVEHLAVRGDDPQAAAILHELIEKLTGYLQRQPRLAAAAAPP